MSIVIRKTCSPEDIAQCLAIRFEVFVKGQNVPLLEEQDGKDAQSEHYLLSMDGTAIGTARVRYIGTKAKIERVAILRAYQGQGLGKRLMEHILRHIAADGRATIITLGSQTHAIAFYEKLGFNICSEEYMDAGILHRDMQLPLVNA